MDIHIHGSAVALDVQAAVAAHPNKMPFNGVLTRVDVPSDSAPNGSSGKRVQVTRLAAERALPTLIGMGVNFGATMVAHSLKSVVGIIEAASLEGNDIRISGYVFAKNFPGEASTIKAQQHKLGFSYELDVLDIESSTADPMVITDCVFTGAAILLRDKAAYLNTSLAASAAKEFIMDKETQDAITNAVTAAIKPVTEQVTSLAASVDDLKKNPVQIAAANMLPKVEPHAARLEAAADKMESDGIGASDNMGHAKILRNMASDMRSSAARGEMPSRFYGAMMASAAPVAESPEVKALKDEIASMGTKIADLQASKVAASPAPPRPTEKTERAAVPHTAQTILASKGIELPYNDDGGINVGKLDAAFDAARISADQSRMIKSTLLASGAKFS